MVAVSSDWNKLREAVHSCLDNAFDDLVTCVIRMDQNSQRPELTYAAFKMTPYQQEGEAEYIHQDDGNIRQVDRYEIVISLQTYGPDALSAMFDAKRKFRGKSFKEFCYIAFTNAELCASIKSVDSILDITEVIGTTYEQRAQMDLRLSYAQVTIDKGVCGTGLDIKKLEGTLELNRADDDPAPITKDIKII